LQSLRGFNLLFSGTIKSTKIKVLLEVPWNYLFNPFSGIPKTALGPKNLPNLNPFKPGPSILGNPKPF